MKEDAVHVPSSESTHAGPATRDKVSLIEAKYAQIVLLGVLHRVLLGCEA